VGELQNQGGGGREGGKRVVGAQIKGGLSRGMEGGEGEEKRGVWCGCC
jgi:hypothetical protein